MANKRAFSLHRGVSLVLTAALLAACGPLGTSVKPRTRATTAVTPVKPIVPTLLGGGGSLISDKGAAIISSNGGNLTGTASIPAGVIANNAGNLISDSGGAIISSNAGNIISSNGGNLTAKVKYHTLALTSSPLSGFKVQIIDAGGHVVKDAQGKPYEAVTDAQGRYRFETTPRGANLVVSLTLPGEAGAMLAYMPDSAEGAARTADVDGVSTLVMGYILEKYVRSQSDPQATLAKLPASVEADTRTRAAAALGDNLDLPGFKPESVLGAVDGLRAKDPGFDAQVKAVEKLLVAGLSDVGDGLLATSVALSSPKGMDKLSDGSLLITERNGHRIRRLWPNGRITTFAGKTGTRDPGDGGPAVEAWIDRPYDVAVDANDNVYVTDFGNRRIRRIDAKTGIITSVAGNAPADAADAATANATLDTVMDGVVATQAQFKNPVAVALDGEGRVVFKCTLGIFRIEASGRLKQLTFPGITVPKALASGPDGRIYALEGQGRQVLKLENDVFVPAAPLAPQALDADCWLTVGPDNDFYVTSVETFWHVVAGVWSEIPFEAYKGELTGVVLTKDGLLIGDALGNRVWQLPRAGGKGVIVAGLPVEAGDALEADKLSLNRPTSLAVDRTGTLFVADGFNSVVWQRRPDGRFYRYAGSVEAKPGDLQVGDEGRARAAKLGKVAGIALRANGNMLIAEASDPTSFRLREVTPDGLIHAVTLPEGVITPGMLTEAADQSILASDYLLRKVFRIRDGAATAAIPDGVLKQPGSMAALPDGSFYLLDVEGCAIYHVKGDQPTLIAGGHGEGFAGDGGAPLDATLNHPLGITVAPNGDLYFSDTKNDRVRRIRFATNRIETVAGAGGLAYTGTSTEDALKEPLGLAFSLEGDLFIADSGHNQIKLVAADLLK